MSRNNAGLSSTAGSGPPASDVFRRLAPELDPPFTVVAPQAARSPLVFSSPHSGNVYPASFLAAARLDPTTLRRSEDAFVDELFASAGAVGAPLLRACFPRAYLDVNREPYELDPRMFEGSLPPFANTRSIRVAGGLGTLARIVGEAQEIYARRLSVAEAIDRIHALYMPYHAALAHLMEQAAAGFGCAVLIDCHSMPSSMGRSGRLEDRLRADIVLGDRFGTSCDPIVTNQVESALRGSGYSVCRNKPYAGGYITEHYGHPAAGRHALQIEVNRALYMDERSLQKHGGFDALAGHLGVMIERLAACVDDLRGTTVLAAE